nr:hypothetical protein [Tanacetum cinerariifolium]
SGFDTTCNTPPYADHNIVRFARRLTALLCGPHVKTSQQVTQASGMLQVVSEPLLSRSGCSGLVQNPVSPTRYVPPSKKDYEILFQLLFDEYFNPLPRAVSIDPVVVAALRVVDPAGLPLLTVIDQDVPSASTSPTNQEIQSQVIHQGV